MSGMASASASRFISAWSIGDWVVVAFLWGITGIVNQLSPFDFPIVPTNADISLPYRDEQVPPSLLFVLCTWMPALCVCGYWLVMRRAEMARKLLRFDVDAHRLTERKRLNRHLCGLFLGLGMTAFMTTLLKKMAGRPRPNFLDMCNYADGHCTDKNFMIDAYQSFPSGHSSMSFAGLFYLSLFFWKLVVITKDIPANDSSRAVPTSADGVWMPLEEVVVTSADAENEVEPPNRRLSNGWSPDSTAEPSKAMPANQTPKLLLCAPPILLACWIALTRVQDFYHHPDDVFAGACIGIAFASLASYLHFIPSVASKPTSSPQSSPQPSSSRLRIAAQSRPTAAGLRTNSSSPLIQAADAPVHALDHTESDSAL